MRAVFRRATATAAAGRRIGVQTEFDLITRRRRESRSAFSAPAHFPLSTSIRPMTTSIPTQASVSHAEAPSPAAWRDALSAAEGVPAEYELVKMLVFKPKTAKGAAVTPVVVVAREETETQAGALGKKIGAKELRLAQDDLLQETFKLDKNSRPSILAMFIWKCF